MILQECTYKCVTNRFLHRNMTHQWEERSQMWLAWSLLPGAWRQLTKAAQWSLRKKAIISKQVKRCHPGITYILYVITNVVRATTISLLMAVSVRGQLWEVAKTQITTLKNVSYEGASNLRLITFLCPDIAVYNLVLWTFLGDMFVQGFLTQRNLLSGVCGQQEHQQGQARDQHTGNEQIQAVI